VTEIREVVDQTGTVDQTLDLIDTDSDGLVDRIDAQPSDRSLHLAWSAADPPHVTEVSTDPEPGTGTRYTWTYDYTGDQLDKVCGPRDPTECTTYIWGSGGGEDAKITEIRSPGNDTGTDTTATKVTYHDDGTAATAENGAGDQWAYTRDLTTAEGLFHPVEPTRVASLPAFVGSETHNVDITAALGSIDPADVQSAVVRITVDNATNDRFFMPHLPGEGTGSSFVNYVAGETNDMTIPLAVDDTGVFALTAPASLTRADVYVDVVGWYAKAGVPDGLAFHSTQPMSVYDSDLSGGTFGSGETRSIDLSSHLAADAQVALVNLVSVEPDTDTALSAWSADGSEPAQSQAQGWAGEINKNVAWVPVSADHEINVKHLAGTGHVAVELLGWFAPPTPATPGLVYRPLPSGYRKLLGSQPGSQVGPYSTPWATQATRAVPVAGVVGIPGSGAEVVVGSIVPVEHHGDVKLTTHTADRPRSDVTAARGYTGEAAADTLHANIGGDGHMLVFNELANTDVVVHAYGWYQLSDTVATVTTPHSQTLTHTFDYADRLIETAESDPDTGDTYLTTYRYNARGNLDLVVDPTDAADRYWYDEVGRRIGEARQLGSTADEGEAAFYTTWEYDDDIEDRTDPRFAEPIAERDPRSTVSFDPDTGAPSSTDDTYKTTWVRDAQGRTITETLPGVNTNWEGDKAALSTDFVYTDGTEAVPVEFGGGTSPAGLLASRIDPGGVRTDYVHDAAGDL
ncbi:MAG: hypothetical protein GY788_16515, partial [bacterium]|nr:hypothetical protein [bacterium]